MTSVNNLTLDHFQDQICYVQCSFCTTILLVSVPYNRMGTRVVTVRCGHCSGLLSVNMFKPSSSLLPLHLFASLDHLQVKQHEAGEVGEEEYNSNVMDRHSTCIVNDDHDDDDDLTVVNQIVNKPPEKKRRAPSAYNRFIKEEITRLKAKYPNMSHKEAFSTAAKNWAHFPSVQQHMDDVDNCGRAG